MRSCTAGNGTDSTAAVLSYLRSNKQLTLCNAYLIGHADDPNALWLTDWESPLSWPCWTSMKVNLGGFANAFDPAVIKRTTISSDIGLEVKDTTVTWTPVNKTYTNSIQTSSPYQLAAAGFYDNWEVRIWTVYMPTPGDANTLGCSELFGGRVSDIKNNRGALEISVKCFLDVVQQYVPTNVIELLNTGAAYTGATPPDHYTQIPQYQVVAGSSTDVIVGTQLSPNPGSTLHTNSVRGGYIVFNQGAGSTLGGIWSSVIQNVGVTSSGGGIGGGGTHFDQFVLGNPLPWPPALTDTFYISGSAPINKDDGDYFGFPYVPSAQSGF